MNKIRLLLADDHRVLVESLAMLVGTMDGVEVVGIANNGHEVLEKLEKQEVEVVLSDLHMPQMGGIDLAYQVSKKFADVKVLLLTMDEEPAIIKEALKAGAKGYVLKNASRSDLEEALRTIMSGGVYLHDRIRELLAQAEANGNGNGNGHDGDGLIGGLTTREIEVIRYIINEVPTAQIAEEMFIAPSTVETHRRNIFKKLNIHSVIGLTRFAIKHGLIK
ncbi:response regulator transcription factor [Telluribacter sp. SYSU D00476]|uniref:response regulator transcription factor n=1 Tax=Telluribacter sp. SYSU D00476 TaxID=2811430 RepID=UPI001FF5EA01|nr:response regulator transcription factor [Telluribacter sp. SYSU D00476]